MTGAVGAPPRAGDVREKPAMPIRHDPDGLRPPTTLDATGEWQIRTHQWRDPTCGPHTRRDFLALRRLERG